MERRTPGRDRKAVGMKLGLQIPNFTYKGGPATLGADLAQVVRWADSVGFESLWVMDHFFQIEFVGTPEMDMLEGYTTLGYFAALTSKVKLGTMVTGVTYRYPGILAKIATTLDVLSGGRAYLGLGAAWFEREHAALGVPYPPLGERFERLEETIQICQQMWSDNDGAYSGKHYQLAETLCSPPPVSRPHPPIMIGGMGEKKTLRMVAQYGQACNLFQFAGVPAIEGKLNVLAEHCQNLGRDYAEIEKSTLGLFEPDKVEQFLDDLQALAEIGIDTALFNVADPTNRQTQELIAGTVIPRASRFAVKGRNG